MNCWTLAATLPWLEGAAIGYLAPRVARRVHPATATWSLSALSVGVAAATAIGTTAGAVALAMPLLGGPHLPSGLGGFSPEGTAAVLLVLLPLVMGVLAILPVAGSALRDVLEARTAWRQASPVDGVLIVEDAEPDAYAVPGRPGLIVLHTGLLDALTAEERHAVLAHERAHLSRRHYLHVLVVRASGWVNPFLRPLVRAVAEQVERWADEDAAAAVGDRIVTARAVARAALARSAVRTGRQPVLRAGAGDATARARALMAPPLPPRRSLLLVVLLLALAFPAFSTLGAHAVEQAYDRVCDSINESVWAQSP